MGLLRLNRPLPHPARHADAILWNAMRIYGPGRLPLLFDGFEELRVRHTALLLIASARLCVRPTTAAKRRVPSAVCLFRPPPRLRDACPLPCGPPSGSGTAGMS